MPQTFKNNLHDNARTGIINGINRIADMVGGTLGSAGTNILIEKDLPPYYVITNDGYSALEEAQFEDPLEQLGKEILFDAVSRANKQSGDGSTTTTVLTQAILNEGMKTGVSGMEIKNSLTELLPLIDDLIDDQKRDITVDEVGSVAAISAESEEMGAIIQEIYQKIGSEGIVSLDNSNTFETTYEIKEGVRFNCGVPFPMLMNKGSYAEHEKPAILITGQKIATMSDIIPITDALAQKGKKEIVIFYDEIADGVITNLILSHVNGKFGILLIKAPTIWKDYIYEDFAKVTGATVVSAITGVNFKNLEAKHLGTCDKIRATKDETIILGIKDVSSHIEELKTKGDDDSLRRVGWLNTKAAVLKVGAKSETELSYNRLKAEDAIQAAQRALQGGVVAGGGVCLLNVSKKLPSTLGGKILREALKIPIKKIITNAGKIPEEYLDHQDDDRILLGGNYGFDAKEMVEVDMWQAKIIDPALIVKNAVRNAVSVASTALTIKTAITRNKTEEDIARKFITKQQGW